MIGEWLFPMHIDKLLAHLQRLLLLTQPFPPASAFDAIGDVAVRAGLNSRWPAPAPMEGEPPQ
jgi:hypothetical protein